MVNTRDMQQSEAILAGLKKLEKRVTELENLLGTKAFVDSDDEKPNLPNPIKEVHLGNIFESKVGEIGLAWIGNIVLLFGIIFLVQFVRGLSNNLISFALAYSTVVGVFLLSRFTKASNPYMSSIFNFNGHLLLAYFTLRLHFFNEEILVTNLYIGILLLFLVVCFQLFIAVKNKSRSVSFVALLFLGIGAIAVNQTHIMLSFSTFIAISSIYLTIKTSWNKLLFFGLIMAYLINIVWFLNDPFVNEKIEIIKIHNFGYLYIFAVAVVFSSIALLKKPDLFSKPVVISVVILNGLLFSSLLFAEINSFFHNDYIIIMALVSVFCLAYAVVLQLKTDYRTTSALYALYGFVTMSIAFFGLYGFPNTYFLLAIQSLLVVSFAIWFRSKFIVLMNSVLFIMLLLFYTITSEHLNGVNISFTLAALISARILNWKKERLTIRTDFIRNIYLFTAFVMSLFTAYHLASASFVTISWAIVGIFYFLISWILHNVKYRYMALGTIITAVIHLFIIDLATIELAYRIIALLFIAGFSIGISIYYSKMKLKEK